MTPDDVVAHDAITTRGNSHATRKRRMDIARIVLAANLANLCWDRHPRNFNRTRSREPWNKGELIGQKAPLKSLTNVPQ